MTETVLTLRKPADRTQKKLDAILVNNTSANMLPYYNSCNRIHISNRKHIVANVRNSLDIAKTLRQDSRVR